jgi:hypothetical protein
MSYKDLVVCVGKGTTDVLTGILTVANTNIAAADVVIATLNGAAAGVAKVQAVSAAGTATFTVRDEAGAAVLAAEPITYVVLRASSAGFDSA